MQTSVRDVMYTPPVTLEASQTLRDAASLMQRIEEHDVLVTRNGRLWGVLTDRDLLVHGVARCRPPDSHVAEICQPVAETVAPDEPVAVAREKMRQAAVRRLPVVANGELVGVVHLRDLKEAA